MLQRILGLQPTKHFDLLLFIIYCIFGRQCRCFFKHCALRASHFSFIVTWRAITTSKDRGRIQKHGFLWLLILAGLSFEPALDALALYRIPHYESVKALVTGWLLLAQYYLSTSSPPRRVALSFKVSPKSTTYTTKLLHQQSPTLPLPSKLLSRQQRQGHKTQAGGIALDFARLGREADRRRQNSGSELNTSRLPLQSLIGNSLEKPISPFASSSNRPLTSAPSKPTSFQSPPHLFSHNGKNKDQRIGGGERTTWPVSSGRAGRSEAKHREPIGKPGAASLKRSHSAISSQETSSKVARRTTSERQTQPALSRTKTLRSAPHFNTGSPTPGRQSSFVSRSQITSTSNLRKRPRRTIEENQIMDNFETNFESNFEPQPEQRIPAQPSQSLSSGRNAVATNTKASKAALTSLPSALPRQNLGPFYTTLRPKPPGKHRSRGPSPEPIRSSNLLKLINDEVVVHEAQGLPKHGVKESSRQYRRSVPSTIVQNSFAHPDQGQTAGNKRKPEYQLVKPKDNKRSPLERMHTNSVEHRSVPLEQGTGLTKSKENMTLDWAKFTTKPIKDPQSPFVVDWSQFQQKFIDANLHRGANQQPAIVQRPSGSDLVSTRGNLQPQAFTTTPRRRPIFHSQESIRTNISPLIQLRQSQLSHRQKQDFMGIARSASPSENDDQDTDDSIRMAAAIHSQTSPSHQRTAPLKAITISQPINTSDIFSTARSLTSAHPTGKLKSEQQQLHQHQRQQTSPSYSRKPAVTAATTAIRAEFSSSKASQRSDDSHHIGLYTPSKKKQNKESQAFSSHRPPGSGEIGLVFSARNQPDQDDRDDWFKRSTMSSPGGNRLAQSMSRYIERASDSDGDDG